MNSKGALNHNIRKILNTLTNFNGINLLIGWTKSSKWSYLIGLIDLKVFAYELAHVCHFKLNLCQIKLRSIAK